jgi:hypothetical protein
MESQTEQDSEPLQASLSYNFPTNKKISIDFYCDFLGVLLEMCNFELLGDSKLSQLCYIFIYNVVTWPCKKCISLGQAQA